MYTNNKVTVWNKTQIEITNSEVVDFGNRLTHVRVKAVVKTSIPKGGILVVGTINADFVCKTYTIAGSISYGITIPSAPLSSVIIVPMDGLNDEYTGKSYTGGQILIRPNTDLALDDSIYMNFTYNLRQ